MTKFFEQITKPLPYLLKLVFEISKVSRSKKTGLIGSPFNTLIYFSLTRREHKNRLVVDDKSKMDLSMIDTEGARLIPT